MSTPRKPDLDELVTALAADSSPGELAGRGAALTAFREARQHRAAGQAARRHRGVPFRRPLGGLTTRLAAFGAALLVAAGMAAAAYAQALPDPVQRLAHTVFAPLGVPDGQPQPGQSPSGTAVQGDVATGTGYRITVGVSRARVPAGGVVMFTGRVTRHGRAAAGVRVRLFARLAGSAQFTLAAAGVTGPLGEFRVSSPPLTATTIFRVTGPDGTHSVAVRVVASRKLKARAADDAPAPAAME